ncbi:LOW QUALITY PROTEIN: hypothetical protein QYF61_024294 [Mycteria americana]|uniref:Uncharacterized protein n=1 Tax=Mycteria americana TaxID=33587 RepID=A0AAN7MJI3_MYCAM|nr:LOW QUALITY PROTEIN: hypothetical protein QYF61_024294 [Mycteria americana]
MYCVSNKGASHISIQAPAASKGNKISRIHFKGMTASDRSRKKTAMRFSRCGWFLPTMDTRTGGTNEAPDRASKDEKIEPITWGPEQEKAFRDIKGASAPALELPDYTKPFDLYIPKGKEWQMELGPHQRPVAYYSVQLDPVVGGAPACISSSYNSGKELTFRHPVTIHLPHEVELLLKEHATQALSPQCAHKYELTLLNADNVTLKRCNTLNPETLLPVPGEGEEHHQCDMVLRTVSKLRADLTDLPLQNPGLVLFTDRSSYYLQGQQKTDYPVMDQWEVIDAGPLPATISTQGVELIALAQVARLGSGKRITIYTDSRYAFGVCHAIGMLWKERGFLTSLGKAVANGTEIQDLLDAIQLPREIAVVHYYVKKRNSGKKKWEAVENEDGIWTIGGKPILPKRYLMTITRWFHDKAHGEIEAVVNQVQQRLQIDYADMPVVNGYKHLLVIVDQLSGWVEAFPTRKADTGGVIKALLKEIIPRYGVPESIESDRGSHFTADIINQIYRSFRIERRLHTPYHPQGSG